MKRVRVTYVSVETISDPERFNEREVQLMFLAARFLNAVTQGTDPPRGKLVIAVPPQADQQ